MFQHRMEFSKCSNTSALPAIPKLSKNLQELFSVESLFNIVTPGFTPDYRVIFREIEFFINNEHVTKNN